MPEVFFRAGFTGTQNGMTEPQSLQVARRLVSYSIGWLHHGDCVGADAQAHDWAVQCGIKTEGHPPINPSKRAWCKFDVLHEPMEYIVRNHAIVDAVRYLIAAPVSMEEVMRSGTWATVRYARSLKRGILIVFPDGQWRFEEGEHVGPIWGPDTDFVTEKE